MINIEDRNHQPTTFELSELVNNSVFDSMCGYMEAEYKAIQSIEYSGDKVLLGWNLKFKKAGRTLCTVYPRQGHFMLLLVVGRKEKERVEKLLPEFSKEFNEVYNGTVEGMGQRWLIFDFHAETAAYEDVLKVIRIRRESR